MSKLLYSLDASATIDHPCVSKNIKIDLFTEPFNHVVIDNFLNKETYEKVSKKFPSIISRASQYKNQKNATSQYEGYITGLGLSDCVEGYEIFSSIEFKNYVSQLFNIELNQYIAPSAHFHKSPSKDGFSHRDLVICTFKKNNNQIAFHGGCEYTDDSSICLDDQEKVVRSIAYLYYLNNPIDLADNNAYVGGGTAIYGANGEKNKIKEISPINNRLFIFEMSHNSYHAFVGANFDRSAIVSWFHSSPAYFLKRHYNEYIDLKRKNLRLLETWRQRKPEEYWNIENDPDYSLYFSKPLKEYE